MPFVALQAHRRSALRIRRHGRLTHALRGAVKVFLRLFRTPSQDFEAEMNHGD